MAEGLEYAGQVLIEQLELISAEGSTNMQQGRRIKLDDFLVELNIFEDMFKNYMYGTIVLTDSRNLIDNFKIQGREKLIVRLRTPSFLPRDIISKTFKVFKLSDRVVVPNKINSDTQNYTLHFVSPEFEDDVTNPIFEPFEGKIDEVVAKLCSRIGVSNSKISDAYIEPVANKIKFICPGWTPFRCINWLATKSIPVITSAKNYIFYESNKGFYFRNIELLFKQAVQTNNYIGKYYIAGADVDIKESELNSDLNREMFIASDVVMLESSDFVKYKSSGYLANRLIFLDLYNKEYESVNYSHTQAYPTQFHSSGSGLTAIPPFGTGSGASPQSNISFYPKNPRLYQTSVDVYFKDNINEKMGGIHGNRMSSMMELNNIKMQITVPGRTDIEVGRMLNFFYPPVQPRDVTDSAEEKVDKLYSGYYLITAIHHKVNKKNHTMTMELTKDSLYVDSESGSR